MEGSTALDKTHNPTPICPRHGHSFRNMPTRIAQTCANDDLPRFEDGLKIVCLLKSRCAMLALGCRAESEVRGCGMAVHFCWEKFTVDSRLRSFYSRWPHLFEYVKPTTGSELAAIRLHKLGYCPSARFSPLGAWRFRAAFTTGSTRSTPSLR
jgi:hypothetical protein